MIYKDCDNKAAVAAILERMLALAGPDKRALIERQLRTMRAGIRGEREAALLLDSWLKDATRTAVVHDLRLDPGDGKPAQIDHLLIQRTRRFHLLDTKHFSQGMKITDEGQFLRWNEAAKTWDPVPSPLLQNERNLAVLRRVLEKLGLGGCPVESWVLVAPQARIERPRRFDTSHVMRADQFIERLNKSLEPLPLLDAAGGMLRTGSHDSIGDIAHKLAALHRPSTTDYMARFGVVHEAPAAPPATAAPPLAARAVALADDCQDEEQAPEPPPGLAAPASPAPAAPQPPRPG